MDKSLEKYIWKGIDRTRYEIIDVLPQNEKEAVVIMKNLKRDIKPWCLVYRYNCHCFNTLEELKEHFEARGYKGNVKEEPK